MLFFLPLPSRPPTSTLFPYTTLFRSHVLDREHVLEHALQPDVGALRALPVRLQQDGKGAERSEEHTSELQSPDHLVCRLLLEKKKNRRASYHIDASTRLTRPSIKHVA